MQIQLNCRILWLFLFSLSFFLEEERDCVHINSFSQHMHSATSHLFLLLLSCRLFLELIKPTSNLRIRHESIPTNAWTDVQIWTSDSLKDLLLSCILILNINLLFPYFIVISSFYYSISYHWLVTEPVTISENHGNAIFFLKSLAESFDNCGAIWTVYHGVLLLLQILVHFRWHCIGHGSHHNGYHFMFFVIKEQLSRI